MADVYNLGVLLLAAGASRRFDGIKQLASLGGVSMLQNAVDLLSKIRAEHRVLALGAHQAEITPRLSVPDNVQKCNVPDWQEGVAASIRAGVKHLTDRSHILIMLADQPGISIRQYESLIAESQTNWSFIVCASYHNRNAAPAIFPARYYSQLLCLKGDKGAGKLLNAQENQADICSCLIAEGGSDIDTQTDLHHWLQNNKNEG